MVIFIPVFGLRTTIGSGTTFYFNLIKQLILININILNQLKLIKYFNQLII